MKPVHARLLLGGAVIILTLLCGTLASGRELLHVLTSLPEQEAKVYLEEFEKDTGVKVQWERLLAGRVLQTLASRPMRPGHTVWFGGTTPGFIEAKKMGLLARHFPNVDFHLGEKWREKDGFWTGFYFDAIGFAVNDLILKKLGLPPPTSWQDLLKREFRRKIALAYPFTSGTGYTILYSLISLYNEERAFAYWENLDRNVLRYNRSGISCITQVELFEVPVGVAFAHDILSKAKERYVRLTFPKEGTGYEIGAMALIAHGPERKLGERFMDWVLTERAQRLLTRWERIPLHPKVRKALPSDRVPKWLVHYDPVKAIRQRERLVEKWLRVFSRK